jgi:hypothetical protein
MCISANNCLFCYLITQNSVMFSGRERVQSDITSIHSADSPITTRHCSWREELEGEGYYLSVSQFRTFFIASVRLSLVTRSVSTSGWRLISSAKGWGLSMMVPKTFLPLFIA